MAARGVVQADVVGHGHGVAEGEGGGNAGGEGDLRLSEAARVVFVQPLDHPKKHLFILGRYLKLPRSLNLT